MSIAGPTKPTGVTRVARAFGWNSLKGFSGAFREEAAFRQDSRWPWWSFRGFVARPQRRRARAAGGADAVVLIVELLNSAVEAVVDRSASSVTRCPASRRDIGSAAAGLRAAGGHLAAGAARADAPFPDSFVQEVRFDDCPDLRFRRLRHRHGVRRALPDHILADRIHMLNVAFLVPALPQLRRLRGQHRLQPADDRRRRQGDGDRRVDFALPGLDEGLRPATDFIRELDGRVHRAGLHHHRRRQQPDHRVPPGRDEPCARQPRAEGRGHQARHRRPETARA